MQMSDRKCIDELVSMYMFEPKLTDVFVEGTTDKCILEYILESDATKSYSIKLIDEIYIEPSEILRSGLEDNNRDRIIYLITAISTKFSSQCIGVIDKDVLPYYRPIPYIDSLITTDFSCMEMYVYTVECLERLLQLGFCTSLLSADDLYRWMTKPLIEIFAVRLVEKREKLAFQKVGIEKDLSINGRELTFDFRKYIDRILTKNSFMQRRDEFLNKFQSTIDELSDCDCRDCINGHDFVSILLWILKEFGVVSRQTDEKTLIASLRLNIAKAEMEQKPLIINLRKKVG